MKNLVFLNRGIIAPNSQLAPDLPVASSVFDTISDSLTVVLGPGEFDGLIEVQQFAKNGTNNVLASYNVDPEDKLLLFTHFVDTQQLIFVFALGDIIVANYGADTVEIVGSISDKILAASWSPDEEILSILSGAGNIILLSRELEPITERKLSVEDASKSKHVSVGWGKRETQFKGKGARAHERAILESLHNSGLKKGEQIHDPTMAIKEEKGFKSEFDTSKATISWRGDCHYFAVSVLETINTVERRLIRVFDREANLDSVSEPVDGLEEHLAWKPQGALIASTQRKNKNSEVNEHTARDILINPEFVDETEQFYDLDLIFFERNGLRHGEFSLRLPLGERVHDLSWNSSSEALAVVLSDRIQVWTMKNYHWYLKQELHTFHSELIKFIKWHPEKPLTLLVATQSSVEILNLAYQEICGPSIPPVDSAMVSVIDGTNCLLTPFARANVPPPMAFREFEVEENIIDVGISEQNDLIAVISENYLNIVMLRGKNMIPALIKTISKPDLWPEGESFLMRQVCFSGNNTVAILVDGIETKCSTILLMTLEIDPENEKHCEVSFLHSLQTYSKVILMKSHFSWKSVTYQLANGIVVNVNPETLSADEITQLPQYCYDFRVIEPKRGANIGVSLVFGLSDNGKLFVNNRQLTSAVNSMKLTETHLLFTTAQHQLRFVDLGNDFTTFDLEKEELQVSSKRAVGNHNNDNENVVSFEDERIRAIERGSLLVAVSPSKFSVVLQAPRGNLETIYPRIMVLSDIRKNIKKKNYRHAFETCRTHRIDLDILHDYDPELFAKNVEEFVKQIEREDFLCLFVGCLHEENVCATKYKETSLETSTTESVAVPNKVNRICDLILNALLNENQNKAQLDNKDHMRTILTAFASQNPPKLEKALKLISELPTGEKKESSIEYLCFLRDVNLLYDTALGLYDIPLTLLIAQRSQKDPKEYLPFLQNLHEQTTLRKQFLIDDHLKRYELALERLNEMFSSSETDSSVEDEFYDYMVQHSLYKSGLKYAHNDPEKRNKVLQFYAEHLFEIKNFGESGVIYEMLKDYSNAMESYIHAEKWQNAISVVKRNVSELQKLPETCDRLVSSLSNVHRYQEAAYIENHVLHNVLAAIRLLCKDHRYDEAVLIASSVDDAEKQKELIDVEIRTLLKEGYGDIAELISDCSAQIISQTRRLNQLRETKKADPYKYYGLSDNFGETEGQDGDIPDDVSIAASSVSTKLSFFTRYTGKTSGTAQTGASRRTVKNKRREARKKARGKQGTVYEESYLVESFGRLIQRLEDAQAEVSRLCEGLLRFEEFMLAFSVQSSFQKTLQSLTEWLPVVYSADEDDRTRINENGELYLLDVPKIPEIKPFKGFEMLNY